MYERCYENAIRALVQCIRGPATTQRDCAADVLRELIRYKESKDANRDGYVPWLKREARLPERGKL
jgi:hypothetical protein